MIYNNDKLSIYYKEREIIYKYRFLSPSAKGTVELILENQYENEKEERSNEEKAI